MTLAAVVGGNVWTANVGDSRIIAATRQGDVSQLTKDASIDDPRDRKEYEARGGKLEFHSDEQTWRTEPMGLNMTHSIETRDPAIISRANVTKRLIPTEEGLDLILGCDGLYDALSDKEVAEVARSEGNASERLVRSAYASGSIDNISAMVVRIPPRTPSV